MTPQELQDQEQTLELINSELAARLARQSESGTGVDSLGSGSVHVTPLPSTRTSRRSVHLWRSAACEEVLVGFPGGIEVLGGVELDLVAKII